MTGTGDCLLLDPLSAIKGNLRTYHNNLLDAICTVSSVSTSYRDIFSQQSKDPKVCRSICTKRLRLIKCLIAYCPVQEILGVQRLPASASKVRTRQSYSKQYAAVTRKQATCHGSHSLMFVRQLATGMRQCSRRCYTSQFLENRNSVGLW